MQAMRHDNDTQRRAAVNGRVLPWERSVKTLLGIIVVIATALALSVPAIGISQEAARQEPGIYMQTMADDDGDAQQEGDAQDSQDAADATEAQSDGEQASSDDESSGQMASDDVSNAAQSGDDATDAQAQADTQDATATADADADASVATQDAVAENVYNTDLANLLTEIRLLVDGEEVQDGQTVDVREGMLYDLILTFKEQGTNQFSNDEQMYFELPQGFTLPDDYTETIDIGLGLDGKVYGNVLSYDKQNNRLLLDWNKADRKFRKLIAAANLRLNLHLHGYITPGEVSYGDAFTITANRYDPHNAQVSKTGVLNDSDIEHQKITYTVTVVSDGSTQDLTLTDELGTALSYSDGPVLWRRHSLMSSQADRQTDDAVVGSEASDDAPDAPYIHWTAEGFAISIPEMHDGDVLTFTYTADVDYTKIAESGNASVQEMGNTVQIFGDSDPIDNTAIWHQKEVVYSDLTKDTQGAGARYTQDGRDYQDIPWTIVTNSIKMISFRGTDITDALTEYDSAGVNEVDVAALRYAGEGIVVNVYEWDEQKTGRKLIETREVAWSELGVGDDRDPRQGWTYHVPETDGAYEYEISYVTSADVTDLTGDIMLRNFAQSRGGNDRATTLLHPKGQGLGIRKSVVSYNEDETTWEILVTLDDIADGFNDQLVLTDVLPTKWSNDFSATPRRDTLKPGSLQVFGLQDGESYQVFYSEYDGDGNSVGFKDGNGWNYRNTYRYWNGTYNASGAKVYPIDDGGRNALYVWFYQDADGEVEGLKAPAGGGDSRTVRVRLTTYNNPEWTKEAFASHNMTSNYLLKHENNAHINTAHELAEVTITGKHLYKKFKDAVDWGDWVRNSYNHITSKSGNTIYRFETYVSGAYAGDNIVIEDVFDSNLFMLLQPNQSQTFRAGNSPHYASAVTWKPGERGSSVEVDDDGSLRFSLGELPLKDDGTPYEFYGVEYHLIVKDQEAFDAIQRMALDQGGIASFVNKASYDDMSDYDTYSIGLQPEYQPIVKSDPTTPDTNNKVEYSIVLNQQKERLNDGNAITVEDEFENLSIDYASITIQTDPEGREDQVSYDYSGNVGTFTIPDETKVTITYTATVVAPDDTVYDQDKAQVQVTNVASMLGWHSGGTKTVEVAKGAEAENFRIRAFKYGSGHMEKGLNGAVFGLYTKSGSDYVPVKYTKGTNKGKAVTFTTSNVQMLDGLIQSDEDLASLTDEERKRLVTLDGYADVQLSNAEDGVALDNQTTYYLHEEKAPEGYVADGIFYSFTFSQQADYSQGAWRYFNNDILKVRNSPETGAFLLKKRFAGNYTLTDDQKTALRFGVEQLDGQDDQGGETWKTVASGLTYEQLKDGFKVENLVAGTYRIVEVPGEGDGAVPASVAHSVSYSIDDVDADLVQGEVRFELTDVDIAGGLLHTVELVDTYRRTVVSLKAQKLWRDAEGLARVPSGATVVLGLFTYDNDWKISGAPVRTVTLDGVPDAGDNQLARELVAWTAEFPLLPAVDDAGDPIGYCVQEISGPAGYDVSYGTPGSSQEYALLANGQVGRVYNVQQTVSGSVQKSWKNTNGTTAAPAGAQVGIGVYYGATAEDAYAKYQAGARPYRNVTLPIEGAEGADAWKATFDGLPKGDGAGNPYTYIAVETQTFGSYAPNYGQLPDYDVAPYVVLVGATSAQADAQAGEDVAEWPEQSADAQDGTEGDAVADDASGSQAAATASIVNEQVQFSFNKVWRHNGTDTEWPFNVDSIQVVLYNASYDKMATYTLTATSATASPYTCSVEQNGSVYTYRVDNLPAMYAGKRQVYHVMETSSGPYKPSYGFYSASSASSETADGASSTTEHFVINGDKCAYDGGFIVNVSEDTLALPSTGGPGTTVLYLLGALLTLLGACGVKRSISSHR